MAIKIISVIQNDTIKKVEDRQAWDFNYQIGLQVKKGVAVLNKNLDEVGVLEAIQSIINHDLDVKSKEMEIVG